MICPKCGNDMGEGNMYCEVCGEEIKFVPDYEPEIENSISDVLNNVADEIDPSRISEADEENTEIEVSLLDESTKLSSLEKQEMVSLPKKQLIVLISIFVGIIVCMITVFFVYFSRDNSSSYQMHQGDNAFAKKQYAEAMSYYEKAYRLDSEDYEALYSIADCYIKLDNSGRAIDVYQMIISKDVNQNDAWESIVSLLADKGEYTDISNLVLNMGTDVQKERFAEYIAEKPIFSYEEGSYDKMLNLEICSSAAGSIYYTTDGSEPGSDCTLYEGPIVLRNGIYNINAVFVNAHGICSEVVAKKYTITTDAPTIPIVSLEDGHYNVPQMISVTVPDGATVYYTTDGRTPDATGAIYTEPISIPTGDSWYRFVAISPTGNMSEEVQRKYILTVDTVITQDEAINIVKSKQFEVGRVTDMEGTIAGGNQKYMYSYTGMRYVQNRTLYFVSEYLQEGTIRMVTGNVFAVDVYDGTMYQAVATDNGNFVLHTFGT